MENIINNLDKIITDLNQIEREYKNSEDETIINKVNDICNKLNQSFSGSWQGYHSTVYYKDFEIPPPGAHFSLEHGLMDSWPVEGSTGDWKEHNYDDVKNYIFNEARNPPLKEMMNRADEIWQIYEELHFQAKSIIEVLSKDDTIINNISNEIENIRSANKKEILKLYYPKGNIITRDTVVIGQGTQVPPHFDILADLYYIIFSYNHPLTLKKQLNRLKTHIELKDSMGNTSMINNKKIFIGHGKSNVCYELKDFIKNRLNLEVEEFNQESTCGISISSRLEQMLNNSIFAFIIMTAEDETKDGKFQARMNVIHEIGLFQGRLGFKKAIILLEDGCEEFSNIHGIGQIRFKNISDKFEEIRSVLIIKLISLHLTDHNSIKPSAHIFNER